MENETKRVMDDIKCCFVDGDCGRCSCHDEQCDQVFVCKKLLEDAYHEIDRLNRRLNGEDRNSV